MPRRIDIPHLHGRAEEAGDSQSADKLAARIDTGTIQADDKQGFTTHAFPPCE